MYTLLSDHISCILLIGYWLIILSVFFSQYMWNVSSLMDALRSADLNNWKLLLKAKAGRASAQTPLW